MQSILSDRFISNGEPLGGIAPYPVHPSLVPVLTECTSPEPLPWSTARYLVQAGSWVLDYVWGRRGRAQVLSWYAVRLITPEWVYVQAVGQRVRLDRHVLERDGLVTRDVDGSSWTFRHPSWPCRDKRVIYRSLPDEKRADGLKLR